MSHAVLKMKNWIDLESYSGLIMTFLHRIICDFNKLKYIFPKHLNGIKFIKIFQRMAKLFVF